MKIVNLLFVLAMGVFGAHPHHRDQTQQKLKAAGKQVTGKHGCKRWKLNHFKMNAVFDTGSSGTKPRLLMSDPDGLRLKCFVDPQNNKNYMDDCWYKLVNSTLDGDGNEITDPKINKKSILKRSAMKDGTHWSKSKLLEIPGVGVTAIVNETKRFAEDSIDRYIKELKRWCMSASSRLMFKNKVVVSPDNMCYNLLSGSTAGCRKSGKKDVCKEIWDKMADTTGLEGYTLSGTEEALLEYLGFLDLRGGFRNELDLPSMVTMGGASAQMAIPILADDVKSNEILSNMMENLEAICKHFTSVPPFTEKGASLGIRWKKYRKAISEASNDFISNFYVEDPKLCLGREEPDIHVLRNYIQKVSVRYGRKVKKQYYIYVLSFLGFGEDSKTFDGKMHIFGGADSINGYIAKKLLNSDEARGQMLSGDGNIEYNERKTFKKIIPSDDNNFTGPKLQDVDVMKNLLMKDKFFKEVMNAVHEVAAEYNKENGQKFPIWGSNSPNMFFVKHHPFVSKWNTAEDCFTEDTGNWGCGWQWAIMKIINRGDDDVAIFDKYEDTFDFTAKFADIYLGGHWSECEPVKPALKF